MGSEWREFVYTYFERSKLKNKIYVTTNNNIVVTYIIPPNNNSINLISNLKI